MTDNRFFAFGIISVEHEVTKNLNYKLIYTSWSTQEQPVWDILLDTAGSWMLIVTKSVGGKKLTHLDCIFITLRKNKFIKYWRSHPPNNYLETLPVMGLNGLDSPFSFSHQKQNGIKYIWCYNRTNIFLCLYHFVMQLIILSSTVCFSWHMPILLA